MKKCLLLVVFALQTLMGLAQINLVHGVIVDSESHEPLIGAVITCGAQNTIADIDGCFSIKCDANERLLRCSRIGYISVELPIENNSNMGTIFMKTNSYLLPDATITAQMAIPRKTPVASSNVLAVQIEERLGDNEFVEALKYTPGVHSNRQGGSWGDSEIFMRGFDNTNIAVMINGIPVNDMENGSVYWSNWASLSEVTSLIQTQRGIGVSKVCAPSVGGTINIITKGINSPKGGSASYSIGNDGFQKRTISLNSGLLENGWSFNILGSMASGDGYAQGTGFSVYNFYVDLAKKLNEKHQLSLTAFGAPQNHYMRSNALTATEWEKIRTKYSGENDWRRYNPDYGFDSHGQRKTADYNKYFKPIISLKHMWQISENSNLTSNAYASFGRGGGFSGQANSEEYSEYDWYGSDYGILNTKFRCDDGTFDYSKIESINSASENGSQMIMSRQRANQDWYGFMSTYSNQSKNNLDWFIGVDVRYYKSRHTNEIVDLFGGDYYIDPCRSEVSIINNPLATDEWKNQHLGVGDVVYRDYDSNILQGGLFGQVEYSTDKINAFVSGTFNYSNYWRFDRLYNSGDNARSKNIGFWGGNVKSGINYNINNYHNVFLNGGYITKVPQFKGGAFMSATSSNIINDNAKNEKAISAELGYRYHNKFVSFNLNSYYTRWKDKSMTKKGKLVDQYYINMTGVDSRHIGVEVDLRSEPASWVETGASLSLGDWRWDSDKVEGYAYNIYGQAITSDGTVTTPGATDHAKAMINMKGVHVGGSAQTTASVDATFKPFTGFRIGGGYTLFSRNYAYYSLSGSSLKLGKDMYVMEPWEIPSYGSVELWSSYKFTLGSFIATISGQVSNLFDNYYIEKAWNPSTVSNEITEVNPEDVYFFYALGRTWTISFKINF